MRNVDSTSGSARPRMICAAVWLFLCLTMMSACTKQPIKADPVPEPTPKVRTEYRFPPAEYLADVEEPLPAANTIGAKLDNRVDLRAAFRQLRSQLRSAREWVACVSRQQPAVSTDCLPKRQGTNVK